MRIFPAKHDHARRYEFFPPNNHTGMRIFPAKDYTDEGCEFFIDENMEICRKKLIFLAQN